MALATVILVWLLNEEQTCTLDCQMVVHTSIATQPIALFAYGVPIKDQMMRISSVLIIAFSWLLFGCDKRSTQLDELCLQGTDQDPNACSVLVENVEQNRHLLEGKQLDIRGFLVFRHHFMAVYPSQDHSTLGLTRSAVRIRTPHDKAGQKELISFNNQAVRIIGTFINDGRMGAPEWAGSLKIERIGLVPPNIEIEVIPLIEFDPEE